MGYPKTKNEWWEFVDKYWVDLLSILYKFIGMDDCENVNGELTSEKRAIEIQRMKKERDPNLSNYFQGAWENAPDSPSIHSIPSWDILCDLCSESFLLYE